MVASPNALLGAAYGPSTSSTGTSTAYALTINPLTRRIVDGQAIAFRAHATNTGAATLTVQTSFGPMAAPIRKAGRNGPRALLRREIVIGQQILVTYDSLFGAWQIISHSGAEDFLVRDFGAKGDGVTDDAAAIRDAVNAVLASPNGGRLWMTEGRYLVNSMIPCFPSVALDIEFEAGAVILNNIVGAGNICLRATHPDVPLTGDGNVGINGVTGDFFLSYRAPARLRLIRPRFEYGPAAFFIENQALHFEYRFASDFDVGDWASLNYGGNTALRVSAAYNSTLRDIMLWGGGTNRPWKVSAAKYSIGLGSTALASDIDVFVADDVGKSLHVTDSIYEGELLTIASVAGPRAATVARGAAFTATAGFGQWAPIRVSMTAGSALLNAEAACFRASDVGRRVYVLGAADGIAPDEAALRPSVLQAWVSAYNSPTQVTLSRAAIRSVTLVPFAASAVVEFSQEQNNVANGQVEPTNDLKIRGLHIEQPAGVGLAVGSSVHTNIQGLKIHPIYPGAFGAAAIPADRTCALHSLVWDDAGSEWGPVISNYPGVNTLGYNVVQNPLTPLLRRAYQTTLDVALPLFHVGLGATGGELVLDGLSCWNRAPLSALEGALAGPGRSQMAGAASSLVAVRGPDTFTAGVSWVPVFSSATGALASQPTIVSAQFQKLGKRVLFDITAVFGAAATGTAGGDLRFTVPSGPGNIIRDSAAFCVENNTGYGWGFRMLAGGQIARGTRLDTATYSSINNVTLVISGSYQVA